MVLVSDLLVYARMIQKYIGLRRLAIQGLEDLGRWTAKDGGVDGADGHRAFVAQRKRALTHD